MSYLIYIAGGVGALVFLMFLRIMTSKSEAPPDASAPIAADGRAILLEGLRYLEYRVGIDIDAPPDAVWALLGDASGFSKWNSTVIGIEGEIAEGQQIKLKAKVAPDRTFPLLVSEKGPTRMVWQDGNKIFKGVRTFHVTAHEGGTRVTMAEVLTGAFLPQIAPKLPDFRPSFETFAADLKRAAEG